MTMNSGAEPINQSTHSAPLQATASLVTAFGDDQGTPAQRRFTQLCKEIEASKSALRELHATEATFRAERVRRLMPLFTQASDLQVKLVEFLDQRTLDAQGLSIKNVEDIDSLILLLIRPLLSQDRVDPAVLAIQQRRMAAHGAGSQTSSKIKPPGDPSSPSTDGPIEASESTAASEATEHNDAWFEAEEERAAARQRVAEAARAARQAQRKKRAQARRRSHETLDSSRVVRLLYRKLASAFHPDREPDSNERQRKAALMAEANIANDRGDLFALLELQLQLEHVALNGAQSMVDEQLSRYVQVLQEQVNTLQAQRKLLEQNIRLNLALESHTPLSERSIELALRQQAKYLQGTIASLRQTLVAIQVDAELKRWVRAQIEVLEDSVESN